jgi:hypothetical protein
MKNLKRKILALSFILTFTMVFGQKVGNEWINYNQTYYSFKIVQDGIYKLDYDALVNSGVPLNTFTTRNIQLFSKEKEIPIYVSDGGDLSFDQGDYILFYATKNDGWLDSTIYQMPNYIGNPSYSLFNDTLTYFFTWNSSNTNLRYKIEFENNPNQFNPAPYCFKKVESKDHSLFGSYIEGVRKSGLTNHFYVAGEGYGTVVGMGGNLSLNVQTPNAYTEADAPQSVFHGKIVPTSNSATETAFNHHSKWEIGNSNYVLKDTTYFGYHQIITDKSFPSSVLNVGTTPLRFSVPNDVGATTDNQGMTYWSLVYPRTTNLNGQNKDKFTIQNNPNQSKIRLNLTNANLSQPIILVNGTEPKYILANNVSANNWVAAVSNSIDNSTQEIIIHDMSVVLSVNSLQAINGNGRFTNFSQLGDLENALLMIYPPSLYESSKEYSDYRKSAAGGSYNVILANVEELYLQFGGGIPKHINGIRRFAHHIFKQSTEKPVGLFLIGKGLYSTLTRTNVIHYQNSLVPTFGYLPSDVLITAGLEGTVWEPLVPTGRIVAFNNQDVTDYLNKIIEYDAQQNQNDVYNYETKAWQKTVLHFVGGSTINEQNYFLSLMNQQKLIIEDCNFGGEVTTFMKTTSSTIAPPIMAEFNEKIQNGVSLMNFLAHANAGGFEIGVDNAANWNNKGKYPIIIGASCYTGDIFTANAFPSQSQQMIQVPNAGGIAFISAVGQGYAFTLGEYTRLLYDEFSKQNYGQTLGFQMKETIKKLYQNNSQSAYYEQAAAQMVLNGDPMVRLNWHTYPEFEITEESISFGNQEFNLDMEEFEVSIVIHNLGKASCIDSVNVEVTRNFPNSAIDSVYNFIVPRLLFRDTLKFKLPLQANIGAGINQFTVKVDIPSYITEQYDEINNNQITKILFINIDGIVPTIPHDFAVVPSDSVTLIGTTINPIADYKTYRFEIDTTDLFDSNEKRYATISGYGGVKSINPSQWKRFGTNSPLPLVCEDSVVYFWRVGIDTTYSEIRWREHSFQYIKDKEGWGQDHFFQFKKNHFSGLNYERDIRQKSFKPTSLSFDAQTFHLTNSNANYARIFQNVDGQRLQNACCACRAIQVAVIDPVTLQPWRTHNTITGQNPENNFGNLMCAASGFMRNFLFRPGIESEMDGLVEMLESSRLNNHYIFIGTQYNMDTTLVPQSVYDAINAILGPETITKNDGNTSFLGFIKKGDPSTKVFKMVEPEMINEINYLISIDAELNGLDNVGIEKSVIIGPAAKWETVYWKQDPSIGTDGENDSTRLYIEAMDFGQNVLQTFNMLFTSNDSLINLDNIFPASQYPYLRLYSYHTDKSLENPTPSQIDRWHVLYQPLPEAAIDGSSLYTWLPDQDTLFEGQTFKFAVDVRNIGGIHMDSLLVKYWVQDQNQVKHFIDYPRQDSLRITDVLRDTVSFSTIGLKGVNALWMEINPYVNGSNAIKDQPERYHYNNLLQVPFYVQSDGINPILDVTFDGRHILNGDIINPESEIVMTLKDNNPFMVMNDDSDTSLFAVYLTDPKGVQKKIPFVDGNGNIIMQWIPAESEHKRFKIIYNGNFEHNGKYTLSVQGTDRSGNLSGDLEYSITFEVIRESSITYLMNYPNPFSTSTRFVFTLTGTQIPDDFIIQIMTVTGRVVREITEDELGPIHIGRNITQFDWNGTDEFGDPLANGVYLYRVLSRINGEEIKHRQSGADSYFKKDFGKMYIIR